MKMVVAICALGREDVYRWVLGLQVHAGRVINGVTNTLFGVEHDQQLNVVAITYPLGRQAERYALDRNERIVRVTNLEGQTMTRAYAVGDFVSSETRFDGTRVDCAYDAAGNRLSKTDAGGTVAYTLGTGDGLASSPRDGGSIPKKDLPAFFEAVKDATKYLIKMPMIMIIPPGMFLPPDMA